MTIGWRSALTALAAVTVIACGGSSKSAPSVTAPPGSPGGDGGAGGGGGGGGGGTDPGATPPPAPPPTAPTPPSATCVAATCAAAGKNCGELDDGCGGSLECGTCTGGATCGGGGAANVCGSPPVKGGETVAVSWIDGAAERPVDMLLDATGNLYVLSQDETEFEMAQRLAIRKLRPDLSVAWEKSFAMRPMAPGHFIHTYGLAVSPEGDLYVKLDAYCHEQPCGIDLGGGETVGIVIAKFGSDGAFRWQRTGFTVSGLAAGPGGRFATSTYGGAGTFEVFDGQGSSLWVGTAPEGRPLAFAPDGSLYVASYDAFAEQRWLHRYDVSGKELWRRKTSWIPSLAVSDRGTAVAFEGYKDLAVYEAADGAERFRRALPRWSASVAVQPGADGVIRAVAVGQAASSCDPLEVHTYDLAGNFHWRRQVPAGIGCGYSPQATPVAVGAGGRVFVGGYATAPTDLGKGEHTPNGAADGFVLELAP